MYEGNAIGSMLDKSAACAQIDDRGSKTVEENIDLKIAQLKNEIARLEDSKSTLAPLLGMRIRDIREAMSY